MWSSDGTFGDTVQWSMALCIHHCRFSEHSGCGSLSLLQCHLTGHVKRNLSSFPSSWFKLPKSFDFPFSSYYYMRRMYAVLNVSFFFQTCNFHELKINLEPIELSLLNSSLCAISFLLTHLRLPTVVSNMTRIEFNSRPQMRLHFCRVDSSR